MKSENINFEITHKSVMINVNWHFEKNDGDGEMTFQNPVSGSFGTLDQASWGWSEQSDELNQEWTELFEFAEKFTNFGELYSIVSDGCSYSRDEYYEMISANE